MTRGLLLILLLVRCIPLQAQPDSTEFPAVVVADAKMAFAGALHVCASPSRWNRADWYRAATAGTITAGSSALDADVRTLMQRNAGTTDGLADAARTFGEGWFVIGVTAGLYGTGVIIRDSWLRETAVLAGTAIVVSTVAAQIIKPLVGRARPYVNSGNRVFHMFTLQDDYNSFPSGHTVAVFAVSSVLAARIDHPLATIALYGAACLTALSRVYTDHHWFSDIVFGGILSSAVGRSLVMWHEEQDSGQHSFRIVPGPDRILFVYAF